MCRNYASCTLDMCADKTVVENFEKVFIALSDDWQALMAVRAVRSLITIAVAYIIYIFQVIRRISSNYALVESIIKWLNEDPVLVLCWCKLFQLLIDYVCRVG